MKTTQLPIKWSIFQLSPDQQINQHSKPVTFVCLLSLSSLLFSSQDSDLLPSPSLCHLVSTRSPVSFLFLSDSFQNRFAFLRLLAF